MKSAKVVLVVSVSSIWLAACSAGHGSSTERVQSVTANLNADLGNDFSGNFLFVHGTRSVAVDAKYPCLNEAQACLPLDKSGHSPALQDLCPSIDTPAGTWKFEFGLFTDSGCTSALQNIACIINDNEQLTAGDNHNLVQCQTTNGSKDFSVCLYDPKTGAGFGHCVADKLIDCDGTTTDGSGCAGGDFDPRLAIGAPLTSFPLPTGELAGLDWMDNDSNHQWTFNVDALMAEGPQCGPRALKNGKFDNNANFQDCVVVQGVPPLFDQQQVSCDIELNFEWLGWSCASADAHIRFFDVNGDGNYNLGEPIVLDSDNDGIYN